MESNERIMEAPRTVTHPLQRIHKKGDPTEGFQLTEDTINAIYIFFFSLAEIID